MLRSQIQSPELDRYFCFLMYSVYVLTLLITCFLIVSCRNNREEKSYTRFLSLSDVRRSGGSFRALERRRSTAIQCEFRCKVDAADAADIADLRQHVVLRKHVITIYR